jgi:hypothetical protein
MNSVKCSYCDTALPVGAMFCGECGRVVSPRSTRESKPIISPELINQPLNSQPLIDQPLTNQPLLVQQSDSTRRCEQCGSAMEPADIFCGECGFVSRASVAAGAPDTSIIETPVPTSVQPPPPEPVLAPLADDLEETRIVSRRKDGERFVLQFSTGESFTVYGTGLIGRNPRAEPGEYVDQLVRVLDASRSVSKTHLEFGQEAGVFWIKDRFSGNGTTISEPDMRTIRCQPERRYLVRRGSRVDIGEQFFIVS